MGYGLIEEGDADGYYGQAGDPLGAREIEDCGLALVWRGLWTRRLLGREMG